MEKNYLSFSSFLKHHRPRQPSIVLHSIPFCGYGLFKHTVLGRHLDRFLNFANMNNVAGSNPVCFHITGDNISG